LFYILLQPVIIYTVPPRSIYLMDDTRSVPTDFRLYQLQLTLLRSNANNNIVGQTARRTGCAVDWSLEALSVKALT